MQPVICSGHQLHLLRTLRHAIDGPAFIFPSTYKLSDAINTIYFTNLASSLRVFPNVVNQNKSFLTWWWESQLVITLRYQYKTNRRYQHDIPCFWNSEIWQQKRGFPFDHYLLPHDNDFSLCILNFRKLKSHFAHFVNAKDHESLK